MLDLVLDRLLEVEVEERIPVYLVPLRTPERILASKESERAFGSGAPSTLTAGGGGTNSKNLSAVRARL